MHFLIFCIQLLHHSLSVWCVHVPVYCIFHTTAQQLPRRTEHNLVLREKVDKCFEITRKNSAKVYYYGRSLWINKPQAASLYLPQNDKNNSNTVKLSWINLSVFTKSNSTSQHFCFIFICTLGGTQPMHSVSSYICYNRVPHKNTENIISFHYRARSSKAIGCRRSYVR